MCDQMSTCATDPDSIARDSAAVTTLLSVWTDLGKPGPV